MKANLRSLFQRLWATSRPLTALGIAMLALAVVTSALALIDPTLIDGQNRWIKPTKFALSFVAYALSLAWIMTYLPRGRLARAVASLVTATAVIEMAAITIQAARGRSSHFNTGSSLDGAIFSIMGATIGIFFVINMIAVAMAIRARIADRVLATALRLGFAIASIGMLEAVLMIGPTPEQAAEIEAGRQPARVGAHTVGAKDGGAGLPLLGWSTEGGDLRPAHFFGMHALQILPLFAALVRRRRRWSEEQKIRIVWTAGAAHLAGTALLTWQALRGQPLLSPDAFTFGALATIVFATLLALFVIDQQPVTESYPELAR